MIPCRKNRETRIEIERNYYNFIEKFLFSFNIDIYETV